METETKRRDLIEFTALLWAAAFHMQRGLAAAYATPPDNLRAQAVLSGARVSTTDQTGADLDSVYEIAAAALDAQDFRPESVSAFLDSVREDSAKLSREQRQAAGL